MKFALYIEHAYVSIGSISTLLRETSRESAFADVLTEGLHISGSLEMAVKRARVRRESGSEGTSSRVTGSDDDGSAPSKKARKELTNDKRDSRQDTETATNGHEDSEDDVDPNDPVIAAHESRLADRLTTCAEAGVIETVTLTDFMCHEHLSIDLGPNMNFIIGHNGSGKSAILTAITGRSILNKHVELSDNF